MKPFDFSTETACEITRVESVVALDSLLGEGPIWDEQHHLLYWLDFYRELLHVFDPGLNENKTLKLPCMVTSIALTTQPGTLFVTMEDSIGFLRIVGGSIEMLGKLLDSGVQKFNDGKCDRHGRFWAGYMAKDWLSRQGGLLKVESDLSHVAVDPDIVMGNGLDWSPDDKTMYFVDSGPNVIYAYDYDIRTGSAANRRVFVRLSGAKQGAEKGRQVLDGLCVDSAGFVLVAVWGGGAVHRYAPDGSLSNVLKIPTAQPSSCIFGGVDLTSLFVTSATLALDEPTLVVDKLAGHLFAGQMLVKGKACNRYQIDNDIFATR